MSGIPSTTIPLYQDRLNVLGTLNLSAENAAELFHGYQQYLLMRMTLEQIAKGGNANVDFSRWAARVIENEKRTRPRLKYPRRLVAIGLE